jgi:hypothetical protein
MTNFIEEQRFCFYRGATLLHSSTELFFCLCAWAASSRLRELQTGRRTSTFSPHFERSLRMRFWASLAFAAAAFMCMPAVADSTQPQTLPAAAAQAASAETSGAHVPAEPARTAIHSSVDAPAEQPAPTVASASGAAGLDEVVCKNLPPKVGSRIGGGRDCRTQRMWNRIRHDSQEMTRRQEQTGYIAN